MFITIPRRAEDRQAASESQPGVRYRRDTGGSSLSDDASVPQPPREAFALNGSKLRVRGGTECGEWRCRRKDQLLSGAAPLTRKFLRGARRQTSHASLVPPPLDFGVRSRSFAKERQS